MTAVPINNNFLSLSDAQSPQRHISMDFFFLNQGLSFSIWVQQYRPQLLRQEDH